MLRNTPPGRSAWAVQPGIFETDVSSARRYQTFRFVDHDLDPSRTKMDEVAAANGSSRESTMKEGETDAQELGRAFDTDCDRFAAIEAEFRDSLADRCDRIGQALIRDHHVRLDDCWTRGCRSGPEKKQIDRIHPDRHFDTAT